MPTLDRRLYRLVNGLPHPGRLDDQVSLLSDLARGAGWIGASPWLSLRDGSRGRRAGLAATTAMLTATALVQGPLKAQLRRERPFVSGVSILVGLAPDDPSFPSGHSAGSFAAAVALSGFYPTDSPLLLGVASAVGFSRVYLGHHFPSDVVAGAGLGSVIGGLVGRLFRIGWRQPGDLLTGGKALAPKADRSGPERLPAVALMNSGTTAVEPQELQF